MIPAFISISKVQFRSPSYGGSCSLRSPLLSVSLGVDGLWVPESHSIRQVKVAVRDERRCGKSNWNDALAQLDDGQLLVTAVRTVTQG